MKQPVLIVSLLLAFVCGNGTLKAAPPVAASDTLDYYVINGRPVDRFDGSQVAGKKIVSYDITVITPANQGPVRVHEITTEGYSHPPVTVTVRPTGASDTVEPSYVIDGKQASKKEFERLNPAVIKSITVEKDGVIKVETKEDRRAANAKDTQVNIGYGEADSRDLTYSVGSVKSRENGFYTNMYEYLRGRVAGLQFGPDNAIYIRGKNSMNSSTQPLILVDGVEISDINIINPNDVYSVDVLKDASAAIYGIKGANGVILINTKTGRLAKEQEASAKSQAKASRADRKSRKTR